METLMVEPYWILEALIDIGKKTPRQSTEMFRLKGKSHHCIRNLSVVFSINKLSRIFITLRFIERFYSLFQTRFVCHVQPALSWILSTILSSSVLWRSYWGNPNIPSDTSATTLRLVWKFGISSAYDILQNCGLFWYSNILP